jgi:hypothetical protein
LRSSAGELYPGSARTPRNYTKSVFLAETEGRPALTDASGKKRRKLKLSLLAFHSSQPSFHFHKFVQLINCRCPNSTECMGISNADNRDGRRNDPIISNAPLAGRISHPGASLMLSSRSSAGQLCSGSACDPRACTRAQHSGRNRKLAYAHGRERKESPKLEQSPILIWR